jgi:hypothetical protein
MTTSSDSQKKTYIYSPASLKGIFIDRWDGCQVFEEIKDYFRLEYWYVSEVVVTIGGGATDVF